MENKFSELPIGIQWLIWIGGVGLLVLLLVAGPPSTW